jgi:hypothetical protein
MAVQERPRRRQHRASGRQVRKSRRTPIRDQVQLIQEVYERLLADTETFEAEDGLGADFGYLVGAIVTGGYCEWPKDRPIVLRLSWLLTPRHPVWEYIKVSADWSGPPSEPVELPRWAVPPRSPGSGSSGGA